MRIKYLGGTLDKSGVDDTECSRKVVSGRKVPGTIRSLVNVKGLQFECERLIKSLMHG